MGPINNLVMVPMTQPCARCKRGQELLKAQTQFNVSVQKPLYTYSAKIERDGDDYLLVFPTEVLRSLGAEVGDDVVLAIDSLGRVSVSKSSIEEPS